MRPKAILFDLDGTLLPMDQNVFMKHYFGEMAKVLSPLGIAPEAVAPTIWAGTKAMMKNTGQTTNDEVFWQVFTQVSGLDAAPFRPAADAFYTNQLEPALADAQGSRADETYSDTPEYDDLDCFLDVADACGVEVLIVLSPEMGPYYDYIGIGPETRAACYDRVKSIVAKHSAQLADFSDRDYEKYFLYEIVHFGWTGWVDVEESLYRFAQDGA